MNYHLSQGGQDAGEFPLEELRRRRDAGELTGEELVWSSGMSQWQTLNSVLLMTRPKFIPQPFAPPVEERHGLSPVVIIILAIAIGSFAVGATIFGTMVYRAFRLYPTLKQTAHNQSQVRAPAMTAASRPVQWTTNTLTQADVQKAERAFRVRQYVEGYQLRGQRNSECDLLAQQFLTNWIASNYGGSANTNEQSLAAMSDQLANNPACQDPLILTITAINAAELHESVRRLERAVKGFETSKHLGYPKFFASVMLAEKLLHDEDARRPLLDVQSLQYLKAALVDGSILPGDQGDIANTLVSGWGESFFNRNAVAIYSMIQQQGDSFQWLALVLEGENEINEAWRARGNGYADSVSTSGWQGFEEHLVKARKCLTKASTLRPDLPLAPSLMMNVCLGDSDITEMREWFDRTTVAQIDFEHAWNEMRWGLRPRWYGDNESMLAFGKMAVKTHRFDTDVPRKYFDSIADVEADLGLRDGKHIYGRPDVWPGLQEMYEGYIAEPSISAYQRDGWRSTYAVIASLAGKYDVAQKQFEAVNWEPHAGSLTGWDRDLSLLPQEVAARTGPEAARVKLAEQQHANGDATAALQIYHGILASTTADTQTRIFAQERTATLEVEQRLQGSQWVDFLPTDDRLTGWHVCFGKFKVLPDGALEVQSDQYGHLIYSRVRTGNEFEVRGQFEVVNSSTKAFQAGLAMGIPDWDTYNWYGFRMKRNDDEGDVVSFSEHWTRRQNLMPAQIDSHTNTFYFRFQNGVVTATVNGHDIFKNAAPPQTARVRVSPDEFVLGLGAFNDSNSTVIRYRNVQVRKL